MIQLVTLEEYLMGRDKEFPISDQLRSNANLIVFRANRLLDIFGQYRAVTSGYRPEAINAGIKNAASHSNHIVCKAVDLEDHNGMLDKFLVEHVSVLKKCGLWLESPHSTEGWTHIQSVSPRSGSIIFVA